MRMIDENALRKCIADQDNMIVAMFGCKPSEAHLGQFSVEKGVQLARMLATRDALVHVVNCLDYGEGN